ncbi:MAG: MOSC domain-containing protein [Gammaproteobacteria bacterium]|nr:MOSC domain-containing protein [Gammaproteobacteria bacterium]
MSVLSRTKLQGQATYFGQNQDRKSTLQTTPLTELILDFGGIQGATHHGHTRSACVRVKNLYSRGTEIHNVRQLTIVSEEELAILAARLGLDEIKPEWLGANLCVSGIAHFTKLPAGTRLQFEGGVCLTTDTENLPCKLAQASLERATGAELPRFVAEAMGIRGVTAYVERPGTIELHERCQVWLPRVYHYPGLDILSVE